MAKPKTKHQIDKILLQSILYCVKNEKAKLLEAIEKRKAELVEQAVSLHDTVSRLIEQEKILEDKIASAQPFDRQELLETVDKYIDTKHESMLANLTEVVTRDKAKIKKATNKLSTDQATIKSQLDDLKNMLMRLQFASGGGGFAGGNLEQYFGLKKIEVASSGGTLTFDCVYGNTFNVSLTENINTVVLKNWPSDTVTQRIVLYLKQDSVGNRTITGWPSNILWSFGELPSLTTDPNAIDCIVFETFDGGQTIFGNVAGQNYKQV